MEGQSTNYASQSSDSPCYLLDLPGELRNDIFSLALYHPDGVAFDWVSRKLLTPNPSAITATCKQIRTECGNLLFTQNELRLERSAPKASEPSIHESTQFFLSLLSPFDLHRQFRGVHLATGCRDISTFSLDCQAGLRYSPVNISLVERWMVDICHVYEKPIRWSFEILHNGIRMAIEIDLLHKESALASIDKSLERSADLGLFEFHSVFKEMIKGHFERMEGIAAKAKAAVAEMQ